MSRFYFVKTLLNFIQDEIGEVAVGNFNGSIVFLKDVATVVDGMREMNIEEQMNGQSGARMFIMKQSGGNTVKIAKQVKAELEKIKKTLPADIEINTIFDSSAVSPMAFTDSTFFANSRAK